MRHPIEERNREDGNRDRFESFTSGETMKRPEEKSQ